MPTYEYRCNSCEQVTEAVQSFTDEPLAVCPSCGGALRKLFSGVGVVFKGSGFYRTDSRGSGGSTTSGKDSATSTTPSTPASNSSSSGTGSAGSGSSTSTPTSGSSTAS